MFATAIITPVSNITHLAAIAPSLPSEGSPQGARAYLASLSSPASRRAMRSALDQVARILTGNEDADAFHVPWNQLRYEHLAALRSHLTDHYAPASANTLLAAVRGVLRNAWRLGQLDTDTYLRTVDFQPVSGSRLPAGRALGAGELRALFAVCASDRSPAGSRDAAAFALMFGAGLRRSEAAGVQLSDYDPETGALTVTGKGNRQRIVYATGGGAVALTAWLGQRGGHDGALLAPVNKGGAVQPRAMTAQALMNRLKVRGPGSGNPAVLAPRPQADVRFGTAGRRRRYRHRPAAGRASKPHHHGKVRPAGRTRQEESGGHAHGALSTAVNFLAWKPILPYRRFKLVGSRVANLGDHYVDCERRHAVVKQQLTCV